jgi:hypothetical protein
VRRIVCIFLLMLLPLHGFAMQSGWFADDHAFDIAHALEHGDGVSHHHEDDGSVHYDDSDESAQHVVEQAACQPPVVIPSLVFPTVLQKAVAEVAMDAPQYIPDPIPERPQRPPSRLG